MTKKKPSKNLRHSKKVIKLIAITFGVVCLTALLLVITFQISYKRGYKKADLKYIDISSAISKDGFVPNVSNIESRVNAYRVTQGLQPLSHDDRLCKSAKRKADDMSKQRYFSHDSPEGVEPWVFIKEELGSYYRAGENLAMSNTSDERVVEGWINSPGHQKNMVGDFNATCVESSSINDFTYNFSSLSNPENERYNGATYSQVTFVVQHFAYVN